MQMSMRPTETAEIARRVKEALQTALNADYEPELSFVVEVRPIAGKFEGIFAYIAAALQILAAPTDPADKFRITLQPPRTNSKDQLKYMAYVEAGGESTQYVWQQKAERTTDASYQMTLVLPGITDSKTSYYARSTLGRANDAQKSYLLYMLHQPSATQKIYTGCYAKNADFSENTDLSKVSIYWNKLNSAIKDEPNAYVKGVKDPVVIAA